jgi:hypothetical protein
MGISAYKEITEWDKAEFNVPNHTYLFDGKSNILAYAKASNDELVILHKPLPLDTRRRKFIKVKHKALDEYGATVVLDVPNLENTPHWLVKSDSGKTYTVTLESGKYQCNCVGYAYRGKCKHSESVALEQQSSK